MLKLKDVISCRHNRALLHRIKNNDPGLTNLSLVSDGMVEERWLPWFSRNGEDFLVREGDELGLKLLAYFVGRNEHIKTVVIYDLPRDKESVETMFQGGWDGIGFQHNTSITTVEILCEDGDKCLIAMSSVLASIRSLTHLYSHVNHVGEQGVAAFAASLADTPSLEVLRLDLGECNIGDEGAKALVESLAYSPSLDELFMSNNNIGDEGLIALASFVFPCLKRLYLCDNNIGDQCVEALASALSLFQSKSRLRSLSLGGNTRISARGLRAVARILQSRKCVLEYLSLDRINIIEEEGGKLLARALSVNKSLLTLSLQDASIDNVGLRNLATGLLSNTSLQKLDLSSNTSITAAGLSHFKQYFESSTCSLQVLDIYSINIGDEGALALVDALAHSKSLKELGIRMESSGVSVTGLQAFSNLLCDLSAPNNAYLSNHTLRSIGDPRSWNTVADEYQYILYQLIWIWLNVNKNSSSANIAAKIKVLSCFPDLNMTPLFQWDLKLLPFVKAWFQTIEGTGTYATIVRSRELSAIYSFVRGMPTWVADDCKRYLTEQLNRLDADKTQNAP